MKIKLQEGEEVLFEGSPEKKIFVMWFFTKVIPGCIIASIIAFQVLLVLWAFSVAMPSGNRSLPFPIHLLKTTLSFFSPFWFVALVAYYHALINTFRYCVTNQRCVFQGGIIVKRRRNVPYHKITDVEINQNIFEQILKLYSLKIFTPGTASLGMSGFEKADITFYGLKDAETPAKIIQNILRKYKATGE